MNCKFLALITLILIPSGLFGQKKEMVELQRDVALLQDQMRAMQRSQDEKLAGLEVLLKQTLETSNKANTSLALLESKISDRFSQQEKGLAQPVAVIGSKVDAMSTDFGGVREAVRDLESKIGKLQGQVVDLSNAVKVLSAPPAPPPAAPAGATPTAAPVAANPCGGVSAEQLYNSAMRDRTSGNSDLAIQQFQDYLKCFQTTDRAPNAQYYVGEIFYLRGDYETAVDAFDKVLEQFPQNNKTSDAMLLKGRALAKSGQKEAARAEFKTLITKFPDSENAPKARVELNALTTSRAPAIAPKKKKK